MFMALLNSVLGIVILTTIFQSLGITLILITVQIVLNIIVMMGVSFKTTMFFIEENLI